MKKTMKHVGWALVLTLAAACGDDDNPSNDTGPRADGGMADTGGTVPKDMGTPDSGIEDTGLKDTGAEDTGTPDGGGDRVPELPSVLSLTGCTELGVGPLCGLTQDGTRLDLDCGGWPLAGTVDEDGEIELSGAARTTEDGTSVELDCEGAFARGQVQLDCSRTDTSSTGAATETSCEARSDRVVMPDVGCMELPAQIGDVVVCTEGDAMGGATVSLGACEVIQDGCVFQAMCADATFVGSVDTQGVSFEFPVVALADAEGDEPAFLAGETVSHACSATLEEGAFTGSCGAGRAGRRGTNTSVCSVGGTPGTVAQCAPVAADTEQMFVLDSCDILKNGESGIPGIGEPVCLFRQNNCIWEVNCGNQDLLTFSGRLQPGDTAVDWTLATGTPCEATFDAQGGMSGSCTVPGQPSCSLSSKDASPGSDACPVVPAEDGFYAYGCGARETSLDCRRTMQHGCDFLALCSFTARYPGSVIAGQVSFGDDPELGHMDFNGLNDWTCWVDEASATEIASGDRSDGEWYGQCTNPAGGMCRDNYDPETGSGFRGLQLFFDGDDD